MCSSALYGNETNRSTAVSFECLPMYFGSKVKWTLKEACMELITSLYTGKGVTVLLLVVVSLAFAPGFSKVFVIITYIHRCRYLYRCVHINTYLRVCTHIYIYTYKYFPQVFSLTLQWKSTPDLVTSFRDHVCMM